VGRVDLDSLSQEALLELPDQAGEREFVFTNPDTGNGIPHQEVLLSSMPTSGFSNFIFHDLRHT